MALDALIKKYFTVVILAMVAMSAYFEAAGATQLLGAALLAAPSGSAPHAVPAPPIVIPSRERSTADAIIDRNPFDSVTGPLHPKPEPEALTPKPDTIANTDPLTAPQCDGVSALIITESTDRLWSVAALQATGETAPKMRRVGDDVGGKKIEFIGFNPRESSPAVWCSSGGQLCQVLLFKSAAQPTPTAAPVAAAPPPPPPPPAGGAVPADIASRIQKVSDSEFNVDRQVVDKILENQAELMKSARIVPEQKDGKVVGIRLFGVRPDTLLGTLGLQNGDRLETINGFNMASPEKALEAYARLRAASELNIKVNRRGSPVSIDYHIK
ncbi:MAG TPA: type II secretion system protein GspC [Polyangiaceae bacterium]|nr:type II secretion system protein GspC [Polyangiaceae bacterium]